MWCNWTLPDYLRIQDHWLEFGPPVHISMAAFIGYKGRKRRRKPVSEKEQESSFEQLMAMFPGGTVR